MPAKVLAIIFSLRCSALESSYHMCFDPKTSIGDLEENEKQWVGTWSASPTDLSSAPIQLHNETLRAIVRISLGGEQVRARLSNTFGTQPLLIGAANVAMAGEGASIKVGSDRALTFNGNPSITILPGATVLSDPVELEVSALVDLAISLYLPHTVTAITGNFGTAHFFISLTGDFTGAADLPTPFVSPLLSRDIPLPILTGIDVMTSKKAKALVAFGDSLTVGPWPDLLAERLLSGEKQLPPLAVLRQAILGNRILHAGAGPIGSQFGPAGIVRFEHDALTQSGVGYIVVLEGINDLIHPGLVAPTSEEVSADDLIVGLNQYVQQAHKRGYKIFGGTLAPFGGYTAGFTIEREAKRQTVNTWIRTSGAFDGVLDVDKAIRDPDEPVHLLSSYDSGDHLHFNALGAQAVAHAFDLAIL
jgi:lysophospholipase L1-like esterase